MRNVRRFEKHRSPAGLSLPDRGHRRTGPAGATNSRGRTLSIGATINHVRISPDPWPDSANALATVFPADLFERAQLVAGNAGAALELAAALTEAVPLPGCGATAQRWELLATLAAADLTAARVAEAHLDAVAILAEAAIATDSPELSALGVTPASTWGVFAAEGRGTKVTATVSSDGSWVLDGVKPWCSLAGVLSHALVTAHTDAGRRLFAISLRGPDVEQQKGTWFSLGLAQVDSGAIELHGTPAIPVGEPLWYLERAGFAWGGMGVAACWFGGAVGLARSLYRAAKSGPEVDQIGQMQLGAVDIALTSAAALLFVGAAEVDCGRADGERGGILAGQIRGAVAGAAEVVLTRVGHALGPAPLALNAEHGRRVADLEIYIRQHHAERDEAALGRQLLAAEARW